MWLLMSAMHQAGRLHLARSSRYWQAFASNALTMHAGIAYHANYLAAVISSAGSACWHIVSTAAVSLVE
jgi:hypothetical protein